MQRLIEDWNATQKPYPKGACLHHLFEEQVRKTPQHIAVLFEPEQLTYGEVNLRANQIAHYLRLHDVRTETLVGLFLERSLACILTPQQGLDVCPRGWCSVTTKSSLGFP